MDIRNRKAEHVEAAKRMDVEYEISAGFEDVRFIHSSLPEMDLEEIDLRCSFLGKNLSAPLIVSGMTGGYPGAQKINLSLAEAAEKEGLAFGLGSQRAMLEKPELAQTYKVRKVAPSIPIIGNIGACQLKNYGVEKIRAMLEEVEADALAIHLNPLQEMVQQEGDKKFSGILEQIGLFVDELGLPIIAKETGAGISKEIALALKKAGVCTIDISGAGGTSWSKVEYLRGKARPTFEDWGNPTVECIAACSGIIEVIGSGGVRDGLDAAKCIALGASYAAAALPFIRAKDPLAEMRLWKEELKTAMLLSGCKNIDRLKKAKLVITGETAEALKLLGIETSSYAKR
ncbi:MAG: type 2 isopentenyl-diphosphate Delta-isomerase [Candidatus Micrarchaeota archaeon]|nr:type 2 isopentenyl-diphosphate Delta-isomerase [Candidatus Micrarchaeota archaeon]